ncbi:MAG: endo-1,3-alpha-glucanase family glycosylhydrolase [Thermofilaceae archaeon]
MRAAKVITVLAFLALVASLTESNGVTAFRVVVEVETKSDWTTVTVPGFTPLSFSIVEGERAPGLRVTAAGSSIHVGKRQYDTTLVKVRVEGWLVFTNDAVNVTVAKGDLEYTTIRVLAIVEGEERLVWSFTNTGVVPGSAGVNPRSSLLPKSALLGAQAVAVEVRELRAPRLVLAFYYPWYGNPQGASRRWFHWERVSYAEIGSATNFPLLGPYDSWDARLVKSHIEMAKAAGIDGFIVSWWGPGSFEDEAFSRMLEVAGEAGFNLTIYYESVREMTAEQVARELSYVLSRYSKHPAFLKIEGRPVVFVYAVEAYSRDPEFWRGVLRSAEESAGVKAIWIADTFNTAYLTVFDGLHTYNPIWVRDHAATYAEQSRLVKSFISVGEGAAVRKLWAATVNPGYDDRKIRRPGAYVAREEGGYYRRTWEAAIASEPDMILICSWNEWHEGTEIEPSREYGFQYLRMTREYVARYKGWEPPIGKAPRVRVELAGEGNAIAVAVSNVGEEPIVAARLTVVNASVGVAVEPAGFHAYTLPINRTSHAAFLPYIGPGERVELRGVAAGRLVKVRVEAWSASGQPATEEATIEVEASSAREPQVQARKGEGFTTLLALTAAVGAGLAAAALLFKLTRKSRASS